ncbi:acetylcholinesterase-1 [Trichonephila clavipes]|nr:acetylcholinesterase-1 [Trichonephila clavipes]
MNSADRVVMTNNGPVQGITVASDNHQQIEAFLGIPYAEPPVDRLRFQKPVPKTSWSGVFDASTLPQTCAQNITENYYWEPSIENMTEDCLYLNLWVPYSKRSSKLKPIVIYFHGGAFNVGSGNQAAYNGVKLAQFGDIIMVTFNYRVGVLGFFSAFVEEADGNMGVYDQILAMKWIHDNAKYFGGDPDHIVLMGESAGAMSISAHVVSPMTRGMIKRVILMSGSATLPLSLDDNVKLYETSQKVATLVGCADKKFTLRDNPSLIVQCMKRLPAEKLTAAEGLLKQTNPITFIPRSGDKFLPRPIIDELKDGNFKDMEMLVGINKNEGTFFLSVAAPQYFGRYGVNAVKTISRRFAHQLIRLMFGFMGQSNEKEISDFYVNSVENGTSDKYTHAIANSLGDCLVSCPDVFNAEFHSMRNPVYFYLFNRRPSSTPMDDWIGATHYDIIQYVFGNTLFENFTAEEEKFSHKIMSRWMAFIKTGVPDIPGEITWPLYRHDKQEYLELNDEEVVRIRPDNYRCEFWRDRSRAQIDDKIYSKVRRSLMPVSSGHRCEANYLLKIASVLLASLWTMVGFI